MRLIDEHSTIVTVEKILEKYGFTRECTVTDEIHDAIENIPTAYDIDKVVEELKNMKTICGAGTIVGGDYIHRNDAIEIVKQGGVSDDVCEWESDYGFVTDKYKIETSCGYTFYDLHHAVPFKYCPYCGNKILCKE